MSIDEILIHLGEDRENYYNSVTPPVMQSSNFVFDNVEDFRAALSNELNHHIYTRGNNPTVEILRKKVAALEKAEDALVTSSGAAAIASSVIANVSSGDHIICVEKPYAWTNKLLTNLLSRFNVSHTFVNATNVAEIEKAIKPNTTLLFLESPNSLTFEIQDLQACSELAKKYNLTTIIDNSYCSPIYQNPIEYGIDIVIHSASKYINGHSDVVVGVICSSKEMVQKIFQTEYMTLGCNISPHDASLVLRGLRTLPMRIERSNATALTIAKWLRTHPRIDKVLHPFDEDFPQRDLAQKQMRGCGGLFTIVLKADKKEEVLAFTNAIHHFLFAVSWGGYESLMIPSITFHDIPGQDDSPIPWTYVRLYIGLESPEFLIQDLEQALNKMDEIS